MILEIDRKLINQRPYLIQRVLLLLLKRTCRSSYIPPPLYLIQAQVLNKNGVILLPKEVYPLHPEVLLQASQAVIRNHLEHEEVFLENIAELPQMTLQQPVKPILGIIRLLRPYDQVTVYLLETREISNHLVNQGQINGWSLNLLQDFLSTFIDKKRQKLTINLRGSIKITFA